MTCIIGMFDWQDSSFTCELPASLFTLFYNFIFQSVKHIQSLNTTVYLKDSVDFISYIDHQNVKRKYMIVKWKKYFALTFKDL